MLHFTFFHINFKNKFYFLKLCNHYGVYRVHHGLENHYNFEDVIKKGKYLIFVALIQVLPGAVRVMEIFLLFQSSTLLPISLSNSLGIALLLMLPQFGSSS